MLRKWAQFVQRHVWVLNSNQLTHSTSKQVRLEFLHGTHGNIKAPDSFQLCKINSFEELKLCCQNPESLIKQCGFDNLHSVVVELHVEAESYLHWRNRWAVVQVRAWHLFSIKASRNNPGLMSRGPLGICFDECWYIKIMEFKNVVLRTALH